MKKSLFYYVLVALITIQSFSLKAQSERWLEKAIKIEHEYHNGRYKYAKGLAKRLEKKQIRNQEDVQLLPITQALHAKQLDAMGKAIAARNMLESAEQLWEKQTLNDSSAYWGNYFMALTWFEFGFTYKTLDYIHRAYSSLETLKDIKGELYQNLRVVELKAYKAQMNFQEARIVLDTAIKHQTEFAKRIEMNFDTTLHQMVPTKIKRKEFKKTLCRFGLVKGARS
jgi:hypothetical protein